MTALIAVDEGDWLAWGNAEGGVYVRSRDDVASFVPAREGDRVIQVAVSVGDAAEMARFTDDAAWGRALLDRYLPAGEQRWARVYRDADGRRVMRGHQWIGGCERTHLDVRIRAVGDVLERWTVSSSEGVLPARIDALLGAVPEDAIRLADELGTYRGDPSIGVVER